MANVLFCATAPQSEKDKRLSVPGGSELVNQATGAGEAVKRQDNMTSEDPAESRYTQCSLVTKDRGETEIFALLEQQHHWINCRSIVLESVPSQRRNP